jgi:hypothetical protein
MVLKMIKMLRIKEVQSENLRKKCIEINKILISMNKEPLKDSEIAHKILDIGIKNIFVSKYGELEM